MSRRSRNAYKQLPMPKKNAFNESMRRNSNAYYFWYNRMCEIYMNRLSFTGLPDTIDVPTMMWGLLANGNVCYFQDLVMGDLCLAGVPSKQVDVYGYQTGYYIHTASGYSANLSVSRFAQKRSGVVIYSNFMRTADLMIIMDYAERLYDLLRSFDVNVNLQKTSKIISMSETQRLTMVNLLKEYNGNVPLILTDKDLKIGTEDNSVYDMTTPYVADKLWVDICNIWNDFLTWCGVENATNQKRERMVSDEVNANYGNVEQERRRTLQMVQMGFDEVNRLFGRNIQVQFNSDLHSELNAAFKDYITNDISFEEEENGDLHDENQ